MKKNFIFIVLFLTSVTLYSQIVENNGTYTGENNPILKKVIFSNLKMDNSGAKALIVKYRYTILQGGTTDKFFTPESYYLIDLKTQSVVKEYTFSNGNPYGYSLDDLFKIIDYNQDGYDDVMILLGSGNYTILSISNIITDINHIQKQFDVSQNYPNPFRVETAIRYSLKKSDFVSIKVFDVNGNEITSMINKTLSAGNYTAMITDAKLESGTYFYQVKIGEKVGTKKMIKY